MVLWIVCVGGCGAGEILVASIRNPLGVLPDGTPFYVTRSSAPRDALLVATVSFETKPAAAEETLNALRARALAAGGNLVANLRCTGEGSVLRTKRGRGRGSYDADVTVATVRCEGRIYRVAVGRAPHSNRPPPGRIESL